MNISSHCAVSIRFEPLVGRPGIRRSFELSIQFAEPRSLEQVVEMLSKCGLDITKVWEGLDRSFFKWHEDPSRMSFQLFICEETPLPPPPEEEKSK